MSTPCKTVLFVFGLITIAMFLPSRSYSGTIAAEVEEYQQLANDIIGQAVSGTINKDKIIKKSQAMIAIGRNFCKEYQQKYPDSQKMMQVIMDQASGMGDLTLKEIEQKWHDSEIFNEPGNGLSFDIDDEDYEDFHNPKDTVVHPATVIILVKMYSTSPDPDHLNQIKAELQEVIEHAALVGESLQ